MPNKDVYVAYNPHLDEFVRILKFSRSEIVALIAEFGLLMNKPGCKISDYIRKVVTKVVVNASSYDLDEALESLYECVVEVYPSFGVDFICRAVNDTVEESPQKEHSKEKSRWALPEINSLSNSLKKRLIGQAEAVEECVKSIKLINSGLDKFISLFFIGPTGVGKTELARLLAEEYLGNPKKLLKINCGEYSTGHEYAKLIGSPPGYIGHNEKGILSEKAEQSSEWIILFDEIEKAHPKLMNLLLGFLDDGKIVDSRGEELDFTDSIICFTSNIGIHGNVGKNLVGFGNEIQSYSSSKEAIEKEFKNHFSPEFINRLDSIIYFNELTKDDAAKIAKNILNKLPVHVTKQLVDYVVDGAFSKEYGARNLKRFIRSNVSVPLADKILEGDRAESYKIVFKNKEPYSVKIHE